ncbi:hypothetical protein RUND412_009695, partial [Rhizina undulata]
KGLQKVHHDLLVTNQKLKNNLEANQLQINYLLAQIQELEDKLKASKKKENNNLHLEDLDLDNLEYLEDKDLDDVEIEDWPE